jgi:hypothetical protein
MAGSVPGFQFVETRNLQFEADLVPFPHFITQGGDGERELPGHDSKAIQYRRGQLGSNSFGGG